MSPVQKIRVLTQPISKAELALYLGSPFEDMVKFVADLDMRVIALGGELHADAESVLLDQDSDQASLWGGNYFPGVGEEECIEYTSMINVRPSQGNTSMELQSPELRARMRALVFELIGRGEPLG
ncbi:MAG: DUF5674 family protein [Planctomycetota bacterium]